MGQRIINLLKKGGVGIVGTDTTYGLVGSALRPGTVKRIYKLRERDSRKPMIVLISSLQDLDIFKIEVDGPLQQTLSRLWPEKVSVILSCQDNRFKYLHRGTETLAFRLPQKEELINLLRETGPLVAPSANPEGQPPAETIEEAKKYFGDKVDFYLDAGRLDGLPSTLVALEDGKMVTKRAGAAVLE